MAACLIPCSVSSLRYADVTVPLPLPSPSVSPQASLTARTLGAAAAGTIKCTGEKTGEKNRAALTREKIKFIIG